MEERMYVLSVVCPSTILVLFACIEYCCTDDDRYLVDWLIICYHGALVEVNSMIRNSKECILA